MEWIRLGKFLDWMSAVVYGRCLTELGRYEDAEEILLATHEDGDASALNALIDLYDAWGKPGNAAEYRQLLSAPASSKYGTIASVANIAPPCGRLRLVARCTPR